MSTLPSPRDLTLDVLRGGAVLYIVGYYHIQRVWMFHIPKPLAGWLARVALALFCFLSGYLLTRHARINNWGDTWNFYRRRLLRIYPLYLLALGAFFWLDLVSSKRLLPAIFLVNTLLDVDIRTLWFISMIFLFYFITPLYLLRRCDIKTCLLTGVLLLFFMGAHYGWGWVDLRIIPNLIAFAFGILISQKDKFIAALTAPSATFFSASLAATTALGALTIGHYPNDEAIPDIGGVVVWFFASLPLLFGAARWLSSRLPKALIFFVATGSFVLYLSHRVIYRLAEQIWHTKGWLNQLYFLFVIIPAALVISFLIQKLYYRLVR